MSDYQTVTIKAVDTKAVTIEVVEDSHDSRALSSLFDTGAKRGIDDGQEQAEPADWLKIGAMLLFAEKAMNGDVEPAQPDQLVTHVKKLEASPIGDGNSNNTRYRAVLRIELAHAKHAKLFEVDESFGAVADLGGDFDDLFG
jgi:hypothetical protein